MKKTFLLANVLFAIGLLPQASAQDQVTAAPQGGLMPAQPVRSSGSILPPPSYRAWKISLVPLIASQSLDVYSSYGQRESNPVLSGTGQRFDNRSAAVKLGIAATLIVAECLVVHKHPRAARLLWKLNIGSAAITGATAARNLSIR